MLLFIINIATSQICHQSQGVQNYEIESINYQVLCQKGPGTQLWLVLLSRFDGSVDFYTRRTFRQYVTTGVGNLESQFFMSLEFINKITSIYSMELYVTMASDTETAWAYYQHFRVGDDQSKYTLSVSGYSSESTAGDSLMKHHNGAKFSAPNQDNDNSKYHFCSSLWEAAYWFNDCHESNPLGKYGSTSYGKGIIWNTFKGYNVPLDNIQFMIRPKQFSSSHLCVKNLTKLFSCISCDQVDSKSISGINQICVSECSEYSVSYFEENSVCSACHDNCQTCFGPNDYNCATCASGKKEDKQSILKDPKRCIDSCSIGSFLNQDNTCQRCHQNCQTCSGPNDYNCITCTNGKKEDETSDKKDPKHCVNNCPIGTPQNAQDVCKCHENCQTCSGPNDYNCNTCASGKKEDKTSSLKDPKHCIDTCPAGVYQNSSNICICHINCKTCSGPNNYNCNTCADGMKQSVNSFFKNPKHCIDSCPEGTYQNQENSCLPCHQNCWTCTGSHDYNCKSCARAKKEDTTSDQKDPKHCVDNCPVGIYQNEQNICKCHKNCQTCSGPKSYNCIQCAKGMKQDYTSLLKNPKHCIEGCTQGTYQIADNVCQSCHENCKSCNGEYEHNCNTCASGKKEYLTSIFKDPKHCVNTCPSGSYQNSEGICLPNSNNMYYFIVILVFLFVIPLLFSLFWRVIKSQHRKEWEQIDVCDKESSQQNLTRRKKNQRFSQVQQSIFYYHNMKPNKSRCGEYLLCILACSDLTFTSLNSDLYHMRQTVALLNTARSAIFLLSNIIIYTYHSVQFSWYNILTSLILIPIPFVYKCFSPKKHQNRKLISQKLQKLIQQEKQRNNYTVLDVKKKTLRNCCTALFLFFTIAVFLLVLIFEEPLIKWLTFVILVQYGSYLGWCLIWGLICCIIKGRNSALLISNVPDWRVEMVLNDLLVMSASSSSMTNIMNQENNDDEGLDLELFDRR